MHFPNDQWGSEGDHWWEQVQRSTKGKILTVGGQSTPEIPTFSCLFTPPLLENLQYPAWKNTNCGTFLGLLCRAHLHLLPHLSPPSANRTTRRYLTNWTIYISRNSELRHRDISREPHCKIKTSCVGTKANQSLMQTKGMGKQKPRTWKKESVWRSRNRHYRVTETQDPCHGFPEKNWLVNCLKIFWFPEHWAGLQTLLSDKCPF